MKKLNICIVGAGSSYTPELIDGLLHHPESEIPVSEIHLTDRNAERLGIMAGLSGRMITASGRQIRLKHSTNLAEMAKGSDFVVTQIRVGGMAARYLDESIPPKYGMIGQETTGPGGMFKALRTIPQMIEVANTVAKAAPNAYILNYTNPSGIIAEAVLKHTKAKLMGLCSGIPGMQAYLTEQLAKDYPGFKSYSVGLNHLGFIYRMVSKGKDVTGEVIDRLYREEQKHQKKGKRNNARMGEAALAKKLGAIPIGYLYYFFYRTQVVKEEQGKGHETRAQQVMKIEKAVLKEAANPSCRSKPQALINRGGGGYSDVTFGFLKAIHHNRPSEMVCSVLNRGAVDGIDDNAGVELSCRVDGRGATPLKVGKIPLAFRGLVQSVKAYESLTVEAAVKRDRNLVIQALLNHPLAGDISRIEPMVDEMLKAHKLNFK
jgi:6-phospho-beta-glucosidase